MSNPSEEFVSFEKALRDLKIQSEELKKLVSEGEIRAFRDGGSMKFRREDVDALRSRRTGEEELVFADALEDDAGMVTEEISYEDTLVAEDEPAEPVARPAAARGRPSRAVMAATEEKTGEPAWVTVAAIVCSLLMVYGLIVAHSVTHELPPAGLTGMFASK
jgi:excisionase family DNA binding protein